ncbi:MAG: hypothetical protein JSV61_00145 [Anaerolineales bacterium]|nr:MAG: hypothetical protein JSV61_00145 [Anaerolineales bacterium]
MRENRGPWYLLTGLLFGAVIGLAYAWLVQPVRYTNTKPASLRPDFKDRYRALIALAYQTNDNLVRAKARLELLEDQDVYRALAEQAQRTLAGGGNVEEARALGALAVALGQAPPTVEPAPQNTGIPASTTAVISATQAITTPISISIEATPSLTITLDTSPNPTSTTIPLVTLLPTFTPLPTRTPTPTPGSPFVLRNQEQLCDPNLEEPLIQVQTIDSAGQPVPAVEVIVNWETGEDHFFTGLKPELGLGYADFSMTPLTNYTLRLANGGQPISGLSAPECEAQGGERYWGTWLLVFEQP